MTKRIRARGTFSEKDGKKGFKVQIGGKTRTIVLSEMSDGLAECFTRDRQPTDLEYELLPNKRIMAYLPGEPSERTHDRDRAPQALQASSAAPQAGFRNPYNFIPIRDRQGLDGELGDTEPVGHDRYYSDRYSGRIDLTLTAATPIIVNDALFEQAEVGAQSSDPKHHSIFAARRNADGSALLPPAGLRGLLSACYEAVTNSRFREFDPHDKRLGYRAEASVPKGLKPCVIRENPAGELRAELFDDHAWLHTYGGREFSAWRNEHGTPVRVVVQQVEHRRADKKGQIRAFMTYVVRSIAPTGSSPDAVSDTFPQRGRLFDIGAKPVAREGIVHITGRNIAGKHDERVFIRERGRPPVTLPVPAGVAKTWELLIQQYREQAELNGPPDGCEYPRHAAPSRDGADQWLPLREGVTCYAVLDDRGTAIDRLIPVLISREVQTLAPRELLPGSLQPATRLSECSPADRVFGWVPSQASRSAGSDQHARRGLVRMTAIRQSGGVGVEELSSGHAMPILASPKPHQGRFYVGHKTGSGWAKAQPNGRTKRQTGYGDAANRILRGRKTYPVQPTTAAASNTRTAQNYSVRSWVAAGTEFSTSIWVTNLSKVELGALLWICGLGDNRFLRFGGAKPFGFGAVNVRVTGCDLAMGSELRSRYSTWDESTRSDPSADAIESFKTEMARRYGVSSFENLPNIRAFVTAAEGYPDSLPTHYPRPNPAASDNEPGYGWNAWNERVIGKSAPWLSLRDLESDPGLPYQPEKR